MPFPSSLSKSILLAAITTLRPLAASCLDSSFPIPEDAPVTRPHRPNLSLSNSCFLMFPLQITGTHAFRGQSSFRAPPHQSALSHSPVHGQPDARPESVVVRRQEQS